MGTFSQGDGNLQRPTAGSRQRPGRTGLKRPSGLEIDDIPPEKLFLLPQDDPSDPGGIDTEGGKAGKDKRPEGLPLCLRTAPEWERRARAASAYPLLPASKAAP